MENITSTGGAICLKVVGKINLANFAPKPVQKKNITVSQKAQRYFKPFFGGASIGDRMRFKALSES